MWIWMPEKGSLYLWNSKHLHAISLRGEHAKLACHSLVEMSFPYVWRTGSIFSHQSLFFCNFHDPAAFSTREHTAMAEFPLPLRCGRYVVVGGCFFFQSLRGTELHIWFHVKKIQTFSPCWFESSGVESLFPTNLSKSLVFSLTVLHLSVPNICCRVKVGYDQCCGD